MLKVIMLLIVLMAACKWHLTLMILEMEDKTNLQIKSNMADREEEMVFPRWGRILLSLAE